MRISGSGKGYTLWLSASDTYDWTHRAGAAWPGSRLNGGRLKVQVDRNGICDVTINGKMGDVPREELEAIVSDHLPAQFRHLWPVWETK